MAVITITQCGDRPQVRAADGHILLIGSDQSSRLQWAISRDQAIALATDIMDAIEETEADCTECEHRMLDFTPTDRGTKYEFGCRIGGDPKECGR